MDRTPAPARRPTPMQLAAHRLASEGRSDAEIDAMLKLSPKWRATYKRLARMRKRLGLVAPERNMPRVSQLSACA